MRIQCDFCNKSEASVFCSADEAALCDACDHGVHYANKLAGKHQRFSLLHPSPEQAPLCDICQKRRAFLFCQEDRAILCRECDMGIHKANEYTQKHSRFLLTGVKLSATSALYSPPPPAAASAAKGCDFVPNLKSQSLIGPPVSVPPPILDPPPCAAESPIATATSDDKGGGPVELTGGGSGSTSSISEYLMEMLPGWHVEDLLDSFSAPFGFSKTVDDDVLPLWSSDFQSNISSYSSEKMGIWVPQAPPAQHPPSQTYPSSTLTFGAQNGFESKETTSMKPSRKWIDEGCLTVPQISPLFTPSKRSRTVWQ